MSRIVQIILNEFEQGYLVFGFLALFITPVNISCRSGRAKRNLSINDVNARMAFIQINAEYAFGIRRV